MATNRLCAPRACGDSHQGQFHQQDDSIVRGDQRGGGPTE